MPLSFSVVRHVHRACSMRRTLRISPSGSPALNIRSFISGVSDMKGKVLPAPCIRSATCTGKPSIVLHSVAEDFHEKGRLVEKAFYGSMTFYEHLQHVGQPGSKLLQSHTQQTQQYPTTVIIKKLDRLKATEGQLLQKTYTTAMSFEYTQTEPLKS